MAPVINVDVNTKDALHNYTSMDVEVVQATYKAKKRPYSKRKPRPARNVSSSPKKKLRKAKKKVWKFKKTELSECDSAFSKEILERDGHCIFPGCPATANLTNSHYIGRSNWNTRFDELNCIALCIRHHFMDRNTAYEFQKARKEKHGWDGQYTLFMKNWLGDEVWNELLYRAEGNKSRKEAILETQKKYNLRQPSEVQVQQLG